jgi:phage terminase large subunit-like protein
MSNRALSCRQERSHELKARARERGHRIGIKESIRTRSQNKTEFIAQAIEPLVKTGRLFCHRKVWLDTPFKNELADFPSSRAHDDTLDAVAGAINGMNPGGVSMGSLPHLHPNGVRAAPTPININAR